MMKAESRKVGIASDQEALVHVWRLSQFRTLGFSEAEAYFLARRPDVDVAAVRALIAKGCPRDTAIRIVS